MLGGKKRPTRDSLADSQKKVKLEKDTLHDAVKNKDLGKLKFLITQGADIENYVGYQTPLVLAIEQDFLAGMNALLNVGASTEAICKASSYTPMMLALWHKNSKAVIMLIKAGANTNWLRGSLKITPKFPGLKEILAALQEQEDSEFIITHPTLRFKRDATNENLFVRENIALAAMIPSLTIKRGPNNKNLFNYELELLILLKLERPADVEFITIGALFANIKSGGRFSRQIIVSKLLERAHLPYFRMPVPLNPSSLLHGEDPQHFTAADKVVINKYSEDYEDCKEEPDGYHKINEFLYDSQNCGISFDTTFDEVIFISSLRMLNAILKIDPQLDEVSPYYYDSSLGQKPTKTNSVRGETCTPKSEIAWRKFLINYGGGITRQPAFMSTTTLKDSEIVKEAPVVISIPSPNSRGISAHSEFPYELEHIIPPGYLLWTKNESTKLNAKNIEEFEAQVVMPLLSNNDKATLEEIEEFKDLYNLAAKVNRAEANRIVFQRHEGLERKVPAQLEFKVPLLFTSDPAPAAHDYSRYEVLMHACTHVFNNYLKNAYTDKSYLCDWALDTPLGTVQRPNHGLPYTLRTMVLVSVVAKYLRHFSIQGCFDLNDEEIKKLELVTLFSVVGRENDCGVGDNFVLFKEFREASAQAFRKYVLKYNPVKMSEEEIAIYTNIVRNMGDPSHRSPAMDILNFARWLDLLRCLSKDKYESKVTHHINKFLPNERTSELVVYNTRLLMVTGDRVLARLTTDYNHELFYKTSTCLKTCFAQILAVPSPAEKLVVTQRYEEKVIAIAGSTWKQDRNRAK